MSSQAAAIPAGSALRSREEEFAGALTHGIGLLLSLAGGVFLIRQAVAASDVLSTAGCVFYAATLVGVYAASTLSHLYLPEKINQFFRSLDQGFIYLLIVGTFTPIALTYLTSPGWLGFYAVLVAVACGGFLSKTVFGHRLNRTAIWIYVVLGWSQALAVPPLLGIFPAAGFYWMLAGGLCYTFGTIFLALDIRRYHFHAIWHVMVILGSACHYVAILRYVVGNG